MNIFYLDHDVNTCAAYHVDKHVVKQILEYAQLLSTAHRVIDGYPVEEKNAIGHKLVRYYIGDDRDNILYKSTHINHPSAVWVRESKENYLWLFNLFTALLKEYTYRYGKHHATERLIDVLSTAPKLIADKPFTQPTPAMDLEFIVSKDSIINYKNYYINGKSHLLQYTKRPMPDWLVDA